MRRFIDRRLRWSQLRTVGNSRVVRTSIIMPVVGYLLLLNEKVLAIADIDPRFRLLVSSDHSWRLLLVYYGTFLLGVASMLYFRGPIQVRKYDSAVEYQQAEREFFSVHKDYLRTTVVGEMEAACGGVSSPERVRAVEARIPELGGLYQKVSQADGGGRGVVQMLTYHWHLRDVSRPLSRAACAVLYALGFGFLFVPTALTFVGVVQYTTELLWRTAP